LNDGDPRNIAVITVAQSRVTSPIDIYDELSGDTEFMSYVGEYKFTSGGDGPALSITTPSKQLPNLSNVSGLEVIIHDSGIPTRIDYITNGSDILLTYRIFLMLWEPATGITLNNASSRIMQIFAGSRLIQTVPESDNEYILVQNIIEVPNNAAIMI
jgi:hypothetical protein